MPKKKKIIFKDFKETTSHKENACSCIHLTDLYAAFFHAIQGSLGFPGDFPSEHWTASDMPSFSSLLYHVPSDNAFSHYVQYSAIY